MESGESEIPAQLPVVQQTQAQPPSGQPVVSQQQHVPAGQPIMYQMAPGQQQPVFVQVPAGQPAMTPDGQPIQYYYVPVGQSVQPGQPAQPGQPVFVKGTPGQPIQPGQPAFVQGTPGPPKQPGQPVFVQGARGQPAQPGQQVFVQGVPGQPVQPQRQPGQGGFQFNIDTEFLKSPPCFIKIAEFVTLLGAWASILKYFDMGSGIPNFEDEKADFFKGIMIFSWVVVILYLIIYTLSVPKMCNFKQPSTLTISSVLFHFILFVLLLACTGDLVPRAVDLGEIVQKLPSSASKDKTMSHIIALDVALAFGFLSCIVFVVDMVLNYRLFQTQRAQETPPDQGPPQRRVWDINQEYLRSPVFYVKLVELAVLFAAWVCILKYFDMDVIKLAQADSSIFQRASDFSKEEFFRGFTIFSWVMVILLALIFIFSLDKIRGHPSLWTLATLLFYFFLSILLIACCGNLTPLAIEYGKVYRAVPTSRKPNVLALFIGLAFGFLSCVLFVVDMVLNYRLFQTQRAQETPPDQGPPQRRVWDINQEYLRSPVFYVKLVEMALLFAAWVCILKYFDMDIIKQAQATAGGTYTSQPTLDLSKEEFFRGITIFSWVMVILLALTFIFSFDKICSRSSPWTLTTLLFYVFLSILLIACCGNLTPLAAQLGKHYKAVWSLTQRKLNVIALFIGLGFGYIAWITFVVDIALLYMLYRQQRMQEFPPQQASQQVVQQPAVVIMAQGAGKPFQPLTHPGQQSVQYPGQQSVQYPGQQSVQYPGQQPVQYPGQQPFVIGMPPPAYNPQLQQDPTQK